MPSIEYTFTEKCVVRTPYKCVSEGYVICTLRCNENKCDMLAVRSRINNKVYFFDFPKCCEIAAIIPSEHFKPLAIPSSSAKLRCSYARLLNDYGGYDPYKPSYEYTFGYSIEGYNCKRTYVRISNAHYTYEYKPCGNDIHHFHDIVNRSFRSDTTTLNIPNYYTFSSSLYDPFNYDMGDFNPFATPGD